MKGWLYLITGLILSPTGGWIFAQLLPIELSLPLSILWGTFIGWSFMTLAIRDWQLFR